MRTIKFRIWDKQLKAFLYRLPEKHHSDWERFDVQQFTGLLDSKGKEIYEGDIVKGKFNPDKVEDWLWLSLTDNEKKIGEKLFKIEIPEIYQNPLPDIIEIVGNIYENKELL